MDEQKMQQHMHSPFWIIPLVSFFKHWTSQLPINNYKKRESRYPIISFMSRYDTRKAFMWMYESTSAMHHSPRCVVFKRPGWIFFRSRWKNFTANFTISLIKLPDQSGPSRVDHLRHLNILISCYGRNVSTPLLVALCIWYWRKTRMKLVDDCLWQMGNLRWEDGACLKCPKRKVAFLYTDAATGWSYV